MMILNWSAVAIFTLAQIGARVLLSRPSSRVVASVAVRRSVGLCSGKFVAGVLDDCFHGV
jgi:hypothetical protein